MFMLTKRDGMSSDDFRSYWKGTHGPIAAMMPGLRKYVQNYAVIDASEPRPCDGVAELYFDDLAAFQSALATPEGQATLADIPNFLDPSKTGAIVVADEVQVV